MSNIDMQNSNLSFFERLRAAKQVLIPSGGRRAQTDTALATKSIMTGFLPMTADWLEVYPRELHSNLSQDAFIKLVWERFNRRHEVAHERARMLRKIIGNEILRATWRDGDTLVSAMSPEIEFAGCVGGSMHGSDLRYMDVVAIYRRSGELVAEPRGTPTITEDGWRVYADFSIKISKGVYLGPNSVVELRYDDEKLAEATASCPNMSGVWPSYDVHKIRHVEYLKISPEGKEIIGVCKNRNEREAGDDHVLDNIRGRIITRYSRDKYEDQMRNAGVWEDLSLGARHPDTLKPDFVWDMAYPKMDTGLRTDAEAAVMNRKTFDRTRMQEIRAGLRGQVLVDA